MSAPLTPGRVALVLIAFAAAMWLTPERPRLRPTDGASGGSAAGRRFGRWAAPLGVFLVGALVAPGAWWLALGVGAALAVRLAVGPGLRAARVSPRRRAERRRWLIVHAELLASCLDSGMAMATALRAVGDVLRPGRARLADGRSGSAGAASWDGGAVAARGSAVSAARGSAAGSAAATHTGPPAGRASGAWAARLTDIGGAHGPPDGRSLLDPLLTLESVAAMLSLGADADTAWRIVDLDDDLAPLGAAARRSAAGGTTLADAVREHAEQLRRDSRDEAARSAGRAGVLMTAPLGLCFLPAFLCLGLAPVVLGLLSRLTIR